PLVRHLEYEFPHQNYEYTEDCFMLGDKYLVAPVIEKGKVTRTLRLPDGFSWKYVDGNIYEGGKTVTVDAPLCVLPYFEKSVNN
ncbi:MAG: glycoside hydrolase, partial [Clostridia bacterium]|nr:glycoside hydrolase [Clostridia bacterium]